ncbi:thiamine phosphate synthase [Bacillus sp. SD088]|uniref:thiamine phosphate synthase n=1 Tax=Bacillus sp. SD088 TaxID=2782012 RepID=UPI0024189F59|nr:thiamine phosphate synthase [Bacillus sp. SD088]
MIKNNLRLYFIMGSVNAQCAPFEVLELALQGGITCFQLREKGVSSLQGRDKYLFAEKCMKLCKKYNVPFIINDDVDLAIALQADGVHIGQEDETASLAREKIGKDKILGVSVHTIEEAALAQKAGADYVGIGPVYATSTKEDARIPAGTTMIKQVASQYPNLPIVGIGGLTEKNLVPVLKAGGSGVALISAIASSQNPRSQAKVLREKIEEILKKERTPSEHP